MMKIFKVEKVIRDKIPALLESKGIRVHIKELSDEEFIPKLKEKLLEESREVIEASNSVELCEELADVLEVIHALSQSNGITLKEIEQRRLQKKELRGGFENRIYNSFVEIEANNPSISNYLNKPCQYPEIEP